MAQENFIPHLATIDRLDPEDAQEALETIQSLLEQQKQVSYQLEKRKENNLFDEPIDTTEFAEIQEKIKSITHDLHPADSAFILEALPRKDRLLVWQSVLEEDRGEILLEIAEWARESLISAMDVESLIAATETLEADEVAELVDDLPEIVLEAVQKGFTPTELAQFIQISKYPDDTVGDIMDFEFVRVRDDVSIEVVLRYLRRLKDLPDHTDHVYIVDRTDKLLGYLPLTDLLVQDPETIVAEVMKTDYLSLDPLDDADTAAAAFDRYHLICAPVINESGQLIGRVTVDEILDLIRSSSEEQVLSQAGLQEEDVFAPVPVAIKNRAPWLVINLITASTASFIASQFTETVEQLVLLAFLMSIVAGIGGNTGNQTMTLIIRALAVGRVTSCNIISLVRREFIISSLIGLGGGAFAAFFVWLFTDQIGLGLVMMAAMFCNICIGTAVGMMVPLTRSKFGKDPAIGSSVLLTFATDTMGFFVLLGLAQIFLM